MRQTPHALLLFVLLGVVACAMGVTSGAGDVPVVNATASPTGPGSGTVNGSAVSPSVSPPALSSSSSSSSSGSRPSTLAPISACCGRRDDLTTPKPTPKSDATALAEATSVGTAVALAVAVSSIIL